MPKIKKEAEKNEIVLEKNIEETKLNDLEVEKIVEKEVDKKNEKLKKKVEKIEKVKHESVDANFQLAVREINSTATNIDLSKGYSTGSRVLNYMLSGRPDLGLRGDGTIAELAGKSGTFKTTIVLHICNEFIKKHKKEVRFIPLEEGATDFLIANIISPENLKYFKIVSPSDVVKANKNINDENVDEELDEKVDEDEATTKKGKSIRKKTFDVPPAEFILGYMRYITVNASNHNIGLIVLDSIDALVPLADIQGGFDDQHMGALGKVLSRYLRIASSLNKKMGVDLILINQVRDNIGNMYGPKTRTSGGASPEYYTRIRIAFSKNESDLVENEDNVIDSTWVKAKTIKNNQHFPQQVGKFLIRFGGKIDLAQDLIELACVKKVLIRGKLKSGKESKKIKFNIAIGDFKFESISTNDKLYEKITSDREFALAFKKAVYEAPDIFSVAKVQADYLEF